MPEKADNQQFEKSNVDNKNAREITQTDRLNKRLLVSCLQFVNSEKSNLFNSAQATENSSKANPDEFKDYLYALITMLEEEDHLDNISEVPDDIERVIEGGEDENQIDSGKESGDEEGKNADDSNKDKDKIKIKRTIGPRPTLNAERLKGPRGIGIIETFFSDVKLHGKGREREDLDLVMGRLEHWAHRLMPRMQFDDSLKKIEHLGSKKEISNYLKRIRLGMEEDTSGLVRDEAPDSPPPATTEDLFDQLLSSSVPTMPANTEITTEQREQLLRNRLLAEERRAARIKKAQEMKLKFQVEHASQAANPEQTSSSQAANPEQEEKVPQPAENNVQDENQDNNEIDSQMEIDRHLHSANSAEDEAIPEIISKNLIQEDSVRNNESIIGMEVDEHFDSVELTVQGCVVDSIMETEKNITGEKVSDVFIKEIENLSDATNEKSENQTDMLATETNIQSDIPVESGENQSCDLVNNENNSDLKNNEEITNNVIESNNAESNNHEDKISDSHHSVMEIKEIDLLEGNKNQPDLTVESMEKDNIN